jgi:hypothetical protein
MKTNNIIKNASKAIRNGSKNYIGYCNKCAAQRAVARKNDAKYDSKVFAKALVGGAAIYLTVAAVDFAIDVAPMIVNKIKGDAKKALDEKNSVTVQTMEREMAMRKATLENTGYTDYYVSGDTMAMNHGELTGGVITKACLDAKPGTLPRIIIGNSVSDEHVDKIYTVDGQPKCCPYGEDPATTKHEKDVTFPMFGDHKVEE